MATASQRASWLPARTRLPPAVAGARNERDPQPQGAQVADCCEKPAEPEPPGIRMSPADDINGLWQSSRSESKSEGPDRPIL